MRYSIAFASLLLFLSWDAYSSTINCSNRSRLQKEACCQTYKQQIENTCSEGCGSTLTHPNRPCMDACSVEGNTAYQNCVS